MRTSPEFAGNMGIILIKSLVEFSKEKCSSTMTRWSTVSFKRFELEHIILLNTNCFVPTTGVATPQWVTIIITIKTKYLHKAKDSFAQENKPDTQITLY